MDGIKRRMASVLVAVLGASAAVASLPVVTAAAGPTVFATGLDSPRGLAFDERGNLYVAEGGVGGKIQTTPADCQQVAFPIGPYSGDFTARISKISRNGTRQTVASGLPSSQTAPTLGSLISGVGDVAFQDDHLYALTAGAGCSHGLIGTSNALLRVRRDGTTVMVANLSAFLATHPVANPDNNPATGDFEPDGTWYGLVAIGDTFYAVEPNHQELDRIRKDGAVSRVIDFSKTYPGNTDWRGPTAIAKRGGSLYIGTLTPFPTHVGAAEVWKVDPRTGQFTVFAAGLTSVLGLAFGEDGSLFVLEMSVVPGGPRPFTGDVVRIHGGGRSRIASGLNFPTGIALGPDHALYVSNFGFGFPAGTGQILRIPVPGDD
jgi:hypothetical protein